VQGLALEINMNTCSKLRAQEEYWLVIGRWCSCRVIQPYMSVWCNPRRYHTEVEDGVY